MKYAVAAAAALLLLAACPGPRKEDYSQASPAQTSTTTQPPGEQSKMNPIAPPQEDRPTTRIAASASQTVDVQLTEYTIRMPQTLVPGHYAFNIANAGHEDHGFIIEGPNLHLSLSQSLKRGDTAQISADLAAGTYHVYCPVDGHKGKGMSTTLTVK